MVTKEIAHGLRSRLWSQSSKSDQDDTCGNLAKSIRELTKIAIGGKENRPGGVGGFENIVIRRSRLRF